MARGVAGPKQVISYYHVSQGYGGTLELLWTTPDGNRCPHVSNHGCITCVGVCLPIKPTSSLPASRCFIAHNNAGVMVQGIIPDPGVDLDGSRHCFGGEHEDFETEVASRLHEHCKTHPPVGSKWCRY